ncbi:1-acyl-sn-glycerol-3-phosphate acyltransferase [Acetobacter sp. AN02]|uniref:lysophospholipid acyltransferase family protein n=1 Tax=Acetobacter sp. AN02 TaxID=2894186 RepID=UPI0024344CE6|nr:lysophospholipid acyltransferase family protein [Acetobacter sp. AN02]MDG6094479.1 1-acyl-sn-glycerol-3-phosphate acyltransferase [Acetobacter sp. AN02]
MVIIRSLIFLIYSTSLTLLMGLGALPVRVAFRNAALGYARLWCRLLLAGLRVICHTDYRIEGLEKLPTDGPLLIASRHQSAFDTLVWMVRLPLPAYVMKEELARIPLVGPMLLLTGMMPVERGGAAKAMRSLLRETDQAVRSGRQIIIFPEGTRVVYGETVAPKPGVAAMAKHTGLPVWPVTTDSGKYWGRSAFLKRPGTISIVVCDPVESPDRAALLEQIAKAWKEGDERIRQVADRGAVSPFSTASKS